MYSFSVSKVALLALLAGSALAETNFMGMTSLFKRQSGSGAFQPGTSQVTSCASNQLSCGAEPEPTCYTPSLGDVCCSGGYACPGGSFCLTNGFCCPNGLDPETCAQQFSVTLPSGFNTNPQSVPATSPPSASTSTSQATSSSSSSSAPPPSQNISVTATPTTSTPAQFTGAASHQTTIGSIAVLLLGVAGLMGHVL